MDRLDIDHMIRSNATTSITGILYQFVEALKWCFKMREGDAIYIEQYGDIALLNGDKKDFSEEVKHYCDDQSLTVCHKNFVNTLYNWLQPEFNAKQFFRLILYTTQTLSGKGNFDRWMGLKSAERMNLLEDEYSKYLSRTTDSKSSLHSQIKYIMSHKDELNLFIEKIDIFGNNLDVQPLMNDIQEVYLKFIDSKNKSSALYELLGYEISRLHEGRGWKITYDEFSKEIQSITTSYAFHSQDFPKLQIPTNIKDEDYLSVPFVIKQKKIDVNENQIHESISEFAKVQFLFGEETEEIIPSKDIQIFQEELMQQYKSKKQVDKEDLVENESLQEIKRKSRKFMYSLFIEARNQVDFGAYNKPPFEIYRGTYHQLANNQEDVTWFLKDE